MIRVFPDLERLSQKAADHFVLLVRQQVEAHGLFSVALSGGSTPKKFYALLSAEPYREIIPWKSVHFFWTDERCIPPDHPESNFRMAHEALLSRVPVPQVNIHRVPVEQVDPKQAAGLYEQEIRAFFRLCDDSWPEFDLILLGLGEDGHTASLFPRSQALQEISHLVAVSTGGSPDLPRVTLTLPVLNHARHILWLVAGSEKASMVRAVLEGGGQSEELPARRVQPINGEALWLLDRSAAGLLR